MKFDVAIPEWAKWLAQDSDGEWYAYSHEPHLDFEGWDRDLQEGTDENPTKMEMICKCEPPEDFTKELYELVWT